MGKMLTIVVPTYNMEKYLERCLSSMIMDDNSMDMLEVLIINDGSKDKSSEIAHGFETKHPNTFHVIDKENGNYGSCINRGLKEASGKYIKIVDADDYVDNMEAYIQYLAEITSDMIISPVRRLTNVGEDSFCFPFHHASEFPITAIPDCEVSRIYMHNITYRLEILQRISYKQTEGISYTDLEWSYYPIIGVNTVSYFDKIVYVYDMSREGQTVQPINHCKNMWMEVKVVSKMLQSYRTMSNSGAKAVPYLKRRIYAYIKNIYDYYLISYLKFLDIKELREFDSVVDANAHEIKIELNRESIIRSFIPPFRYIQAWDKKKSRNLLCYYMFDAYTSFVNSLIRLKHNCIS